MKRLSALVLTAALGTWLAGCASSSTTATSPVLAATRSGIVAIASGHEHEVRAVTPTAVDTGRTFDGAREGIPLPEPAIPGREVQLAGPTPQIPIPRSGGMASPVN